MIPNNNNDKKNKKIKKYIYIYTHINHCFNPIIFIIIPNITLRISI